MDNLKQYKEQLKIKIEKQKKIYKKDMDAESLNFWHGFNFGLSRALSLLESEAKAE